MFLKHLKNFFERTNEIKKDVSGEKTIVCDRIPEMDELALGWACGHDDEKQSDIQQLKGVKQKHRDTHFYVVGGSGTGKTKFLECLIKQDIASGFGFGIIDPHGDLVEDIKGYLYLAQNSPQNSPKNDFLGDNVVCIDPTDKNLTVAFNPLEKVQGISAAEQAGELVGVFKKIWKDSWGARMEDLLRNSLIALVEQNLTLVELPKFLTNDEFRNATLEKTDHPICRQYFERFNSLSKRIRDEWSESTLNKTNAFLSDDRIRQILISPQSSFNLRDIIDNGKILLVKLDKGRLKGGADLLGSLILSKLQMAAFARSDTLQSERRLFHLYIDEFQNFATDSFIETLAEARKYRLALVLAHQNLAQLPYDLQASIFTNCGLQAYFRLSRQDSQIMAKEAMTSLYAQPPGWEELIQQLQELPPRFLLVKNKIEGGAAILSSLEIDPPWKKAGMKESQFQQIVNGAGIGDYYLRSRGEVEKEYQKRCGQIEQDQNSKAPADFSEDRIEIWQNPSDGK
ncbi:MAG: type IV secretory system conjugative DNA transfer family protein [Candidatus Pacebacteria bacterium]|nr:type IV secretory system conjugative DNA transfer family protein [Candidatus Paceibacterota bacterium]